MLFWRMVVTTSGAPDVMVVAVVTSPVLAVKGPVGTKLKATLMGIAQAGEALRAATAIAVLRRAFRREGNPMMISLGEYSCVHGANRQRPREVGKEHHPRLERRP